MSSIRYRPEIDGLRAVAVIPVVLFHMGLKWIGGGFLGVDVFFVISGYLITSIILKDHDEGVFRFSNFWLRRVRRIFPALVVMLIVTSIAGYFMIFRGDLKDIGKHGICAIFSVANIAMWQIPGGYWGAAAEDSLFLHTWSLSVEEQFYFFYPFIMAFLLRIKRRWVVPAMSAIAICSFLLYLYGSKHHPTATFYLLPTRAWELATGCLVAILTWNRDFRISKPVSSVMSLIGLAAIILSYLIVSSENRFIGFIAMPVIGSAFIIIFGGKNNGSITNRILSSSPLVLIGKISYSLYLWHWPIWVIAKQRSFTNHGIASTFVILTVIAIASVISYNLVEKPTRHRIKILRLASFAFFSSLCLSVFLLYASSHFSYDCSAYSTPLWSGQLYNVNPVDTWPEQARKRMAGIDVPKRDPSQANAYATGGIIKQYGGPRPEIVVLGDSHSLMWSGVIDIICKELSITVSFYGADGTPPFINLPLTKDSSSGNLFFTAEEKYLFDCKRLDFIKEWKPKIVILVASWSGVRDIKATEDLVRFIGETGSKIVLIEQPPVLFFGDKNALQYLAFMGVIPKDNQRQYVQTANTLEYEAGRDLIRQISAKYPYCTVVPVMDVFYKTDAGAWVLDGSHVLYIDDDHLSQDGALKLKDRIYEKISDILKSF
jgi:peptidoglycan/LPS O-acetylase OafA/YrhL